MNDTDQVSNRFARSKKSKKSCQPASSQTTIFSLFSPTMVGGREWVHSEPFVREAGLRRGGELLRGCSVTREGGEDNTFLRIAAMDLDIGELLRGCNGSLCHQGRRRGQCFSRNCCFNDYENTVKVWSQPLERLLWFATREVDNTFFFLPFAAPQTFPTLWARGGFSPATWS